MTKVDEHFSVGSVRVWAVSADSQAGTNIWGYLKVHACISNLSVLKKKKGSLTFLIFCLTLLHVFLNESLLVMMSAHHVFAMVRDYLKSLNRKSIVFINSIRRWASCMRIWRGFVSKCCLNLHSSKKVCPSQAEERERQWGRHEKSECCISYTKH